jgi:hypothetical protein
MPKGGSQITAETLLVRMDFSDFALSPNIKVAVGREVSSRGLEGQEVALVGSKGVKCIGESCCSGLAICGSHFFYPVCFGDIIEVIFAKTGFHLSNLFASV